MCVIFLGLENAQNYIALSRKHQHNTNYHNIILIYLGTVVVHRGQNIPILRII